MLARRLRRHLEATPQDARGVARDQGPKISKQDFRRGGLLYHNVHHVNGYWTVDITNNDVTYTMHNRHGSWMHNIEGHDGYMKEPAAVARMLGTNLGQQEIAENLIERVQREMKALGIPTREELLRQREEEAKTARRRKRQQSDQD